MQPVSLTVRGNVAVITVDNPPVNALSQPVRQGIADCMDRAESDSSIDAVVLACAGRTFIAGADIREFGKPPQPPHLPDLVHRIENGAKPVVAAIHGTALGGGLEVAMGCHYRIADPAAAVGLPEVKLGLLPGATGTQRLPRLAGLTTALDMMLGGEPIAARGALDAGIVDRLATGDLVDDAVVLAREMSADPPRRVRELPPPKADADLFAAVRQRIASRTRGLFSPEKIIQCVEAACSLDYEAGCRFEREAFIECRNSPQSDGLRHAFFAERECAKVPGLDKAIRPRGIARVGVLGAGTMGAGIAYACLASGLEVYLLDSDATGLERGAGTIRKLFEGGVQRGKLTEGDAEAALARLSTGVDFDGLSESDLVIEAVFENMKVKQDVFEKLDRVVRQGAILASNTSTLDIDAIAGATTRPADVIGLHFFSPAHVMRLLEIVRGRETAADVIVSSLSLARSLGKIGVVVGNCNGFVGNRMLYSYGRENQLLMLEGALPEFIDSVLQDWGMAMGPNAVGDLAGIDVGYKARKERKDLPDDPRFYRVSDMLAEQGRYGQKTGRGMYLYEKGSRTPIPDPEVHAMIRAEAQRLGVPQREIGADEVIERCIYGLVTEGARILEEGIALRSSDIDVIWLNGYGFPRHRGGPMHYADSVGLGAVHEKVCEFRDRFGPKYWQPPALLERLARLGGRFGDT